MANATLFRSIVGALISARVSPEFVAKTAVFCRERGAMKDMPALLLAALSRRDPKLMERVFDRIVDSPRMLRTFVQIVRSGTTGRKSLGSGPKRCVRRWLDQRTDAALFAASVGNAPSLVDNAVNESRRVRRATCDVRCANVRRAKCYVPNVPRAKRGHEHMARQHMTRRTWHVST